MSKDLPEPKHSIFTYKWNVVGKKKLQVQELTLDNKYKVKIVIGKKFLSVSKVDGKHPNKISETDYNEVKTILEYFFDDLTINFHRKTYTK